MPTTITTRKDIRKDTKPRVEVFSKLMGVSVDDWAKLFPDHPDPPELIELVDQSGMSGFEFHSIVVSMEDQPVLLIPIMQARYPIATTLDGKAKEIASSLVRFVPDLLNPKGFFIGFVEGEWGQVGVNPEANPQQLMASWQIAIKALHKLSRKKGVNTLAFWQFSQKAMSDIPAWVIKKSGVIASQPFSELAIIYKSMDEYFASVDSDLRRYLKRAQRNRSRVRVERTRDVSAWSSQIYQLYKQQISGAEISFGEQSSEYFERICSVVPGAEYMLYFDLEDKLIGFELLISNSKRMVSKYFGMNPEAGREYKLYFLSWLENLSYCIDKRIPHFHVGASGEELKTKLGAALVPTAVLIQHHNPIINYVLKKIEDDLAYESRIEIPKLRLPIPT